jgi:hypothetical protein
MMKGAFFCDYSELRFNQFSLQALLMPVPLVILREVWTAHSGCLMETRGGTPSAGFEAWNLA